jgi:DNA-binding transcriptional LysR family regulator
MGAAMQLSDRIGRRMKLQDLHILMSVVQAGSMGKAAERLNSTQPAISRSIAELEHALGVRLLDRHRQGVEPTECGRALLDGGVAAFDELRQAVKNIEFLADPTAGEVRIGSTDFLAASFVSAVIDRLSRRYPRIMYHLVTAPTGTLHRDLHERNVDLLIVRRFGPTADEQMGFEFLFDDSYVVAGGAQNQWVRRRRIELAELASESWTLPPPESVIGSIAMEAFRASGLDYP